ncbi:MAG: hypothetical protein ACFFCW_22140, partial [Candidatus Hodarchaeota archaeon]
SRRFFIPIKVEAEVESVIRPEIRGKSSSGEIRSFPNDGFNRAVNDLRDWVITYFVRNIKKPSKG